MWRHKLAATFRSPELSVSPRITLRLFDLVAGGADIVLYVGDP
jgi:hypothetical protein